ncbi:MAG: hypothetical protein ACYCWN_01390 [Ferrimicrobium sp.]|uniref:hypothetical protein n=1 Tax=Ferrimicrobium acidiphilum TaxID=121039 RepID=UPI003F79DB65
MVESTKAHAATLEGAAVAGVQAVAAKERLRRLSRAVDAGGDRIGTNLDLLLLSYERTGERDDDEFARIGTGLGVLGVPDAKYVTGEFNHDVLEAPAGAEQGYVVLPGPLDASDRACGAHVGTTRGDQHAIVAS